MVFGVLGVSVGIISGWFQASFEWLPLGSAPANRTGPYQSARIRFGEHMCACGRVEGRKRWPSADGGAIARPAQMSNSTPPSLMYVGGVAYDPCTDNEEVE